MAAETPGIKISTFHNTLIGAVFLAAAVVILLLVNVSMKRQALTEAEAKARLLLDRNLAIHAYFSHLLKPKVFMLADPYLTRDYFEPVWMSSTFAVREIDQYAKTMGTTGYYYKECAVNARSPGNEADQLERQFIEKLNADPRVVQHAEVRELGGKPYFAVLRRGEVLEESCLRCHSTPERAPGGLVRAFGSERSFHRAAGEVISAVSIRIPLDVAYSEANRFSLILSAMLLAVLLAVFLIKIWLSQRLIFAPLSSIRDAAIRIATHESSLGEEIPAPAGKELAELASAFNRMSRSLRSDRDSLEQLVQERTRALQAARDSVKTLRGMLPICSSCKKIRNDDGYWSQIEEYIRQHSDARFSHGICPDCAARLYPDYFDEKK
jgi:HAMP domain-containing protein